MLITVSGIKHTCRLIIRVAERPVLALTAFVPRRPFRPQLKVLLPQPAVNVRPFGTGSWRLAFSPGRAVDDGTV